MNKRWCVTYQVYDGGWVERTAWFDAPSAEDALTMWAIEFNVHKYSRKPPPMLEPSVSKVT